MKTFEIVRREHSERTLHVRAGNLNEAMEMARADASAATPDDAGIVLAEDRTFVCVGYHRKRD